MRQTGFSTPLSPAHGPLFAIPASPTRYTNRRSLPRKTGTHLEPPRETGNLSAHRLPTRSCLPAVNKATGPQAAPQERNLLHRDTCAVPSPALPAPPTPPISSRSLQTCPSSRTETA